MMPSRPSALGPSASGHSCIFPFSPSSLCRQATPPLLRIGAYLHRCGGLWRYTCLDPFDRTSKIKFKATDTCSTAHRRAFGSDHSVFTYILCALLRGGQVGMYASNSSRPNPFSGYHICLSYSDLPKPSDRGKLDQSFHQTSDLLGQRPSHAERNRCVSRGMNLRPLLLLDWL